ncbi:MAG: GntR family transcriptional regulator, partial [Clostridium sp.]
KGVKVVPVTEKDAKDILEMRLFLEKNNAYLAASRATDEDLNQIVSCFDELNSKLSLLDSRLLYRIDHTFHRAIALATHNDWMTRETELILDNYLRFETKSVYNNSIDAQVVLDEHLAIRNAIIDRNPDKAEQMMNSHLNKSYSRTLSQFWNAPAK